MRMDNNKFSDFNNRCDHQVSNRYW
jgi:hypothetical protein